MSRAKGAQGVVGVSGKNEAVIRDDIRALGGYHVPDAAGMVKLDAMENPYRLPESVRAEIASEVANAEINRYPDAAAAKLKSRLRHVLGIPNEAGLLVGNGSDEIIQMLMLATARAQSVVLGVEPSFVMFRLVATVCSVRYVGVPLTAAFELDPDAVTAAITEHQPSLIFIAYPNNPTGNLFDQGAIESVIRAASGLVVIDEAYHAFARRSFMERLDEYPNLVVMRTLSKSGLAGLRLGLVAGCRDVLEQVDKVRLPYNVNVLTQLVAEQVLRHQSLLDEQAEAIIAERSRLHRELAGLQGIAPYPSDANFILFRTTSCAGAIFKGLRERRVLVKNLDGAHPALEGCLRVTVGTPQENDLFLTALRECLS